MTPLLKEGEEDGRDLKDLESKRWSYENGLEPGDVDKFLIVSRSVGTFARALDCSSSVKQPSLHMRDVLRKTNIIVLKTFEMKIYIKISMY